MNESHENVAAVAIKALRRIFTDAQQIVVTLETVETRGEIVSTWDVLIAFPNRKSIVESDENLGAAVAAATLRACGKPQPQLQGVAFGASRLGSSRISNN